MTFLDLSDSKINKARQLHFEKLKPLVLNRIQKNTCLSRTPSSEWKDFILNNLEEILIGNPIVLYKLNAQVSNRMRKDDIYLKNILNYKWFSDKTKRYCIYHLAVNLDIDTCVYCNRTYTKTVSKKTKSTRPVFDHWFPKSKFPFLALSFCNLIPSCKVCNSDMKGSEVFNLSNSYHPYIDNFTDIRFSFKLEPNNKCVPIAQASSKKGIKFLNDFGLTDIYQSHSDEITDLFLLKKKYGSNYLKSLKSLFRGASSESEIYRLAFGTYIEDANFKKRPLSKLKRDILKELAII